MAAISNMVSSWLRRRSKKDSSRKERPCRSSSSSRSSTYKSQNKPNSETYSERGRLPQPPPLPQRSEASTSLIYEEIPALLRDSPAIVDGDINVQNLDFANAKEMGPYLMVPYKKHEPVGAVFDAKASSSASCHASPNSSSPYKCTCTASRVNHARMKHDKMYSSSETIGSQYNSLNACRSADAARSTGPDLLKHVSSSETDTDSGSGCSCYRTQDILLRPPVICERRRSVTSTETENYYETVGCQVITAEQVQDKSSHVIYSTVSNNVITSKASVCGASGDDDAKPGEARPGYQTDSSGTYAAVRQDVHSPIKAESNNNSSQSTYEVQLFRIACNRSHNEHVNSLVKNKSSKYTGTGTDKGNMPVMLVPTNCARVPYGLSAHPAQADMGLFNTDSDENYSDVNTRRKSSSRKNGTKDKKATKKAETVPRRANRAKVRNQLYLVTIPHEPREKVTPCAPKSKSATYPRLEKTPYGTTPSGTNPSEGCPEYENAGLRRTQNLQHKNKALGDLIKKNHDRQMWF